MKNAVSKLLILVAFLWAQSVLAQDIQEIYDSAKESLLDGNYITTLTKISDANAQIVMDPNLDPNGVFKNKLLPKLEATANSMANISSALEALYNTAQTESFFPDLSPSLEAVNQYSQHARNTSEQLMAQRDSILSSFELDPEFRDALRNTPAFKQIEQFASAGMVEMLSEKFTDIVLVLTDSISSINFRYEMAVANLEKMKKSAIASKAERKKLEDQLVFCMGFGSAAWKVGCRDQHIGWTTDQRQKNLTAIANNVRFLILPWITIRHLASKVLALSLRQLIADCNDRFCEKLLLAETFVDSSKYQGTSYRAANRHYISETTGSGKRAA